MRIQYHLGAAEDQDEQYTEREPDGEPVDVTTVDPHTGATRKDKVQLYKKVNKIRKRRVVNLGNGVFIPRAQAVKLHDRVFIVFNAPETAGIVGHSLREIYVYCKNNPTKPKARMGRRILKAVLMVHYRFGDPIDGEVPIKVASIQQWIKDGRPNTFTVNRAFVSHRIAGHDDGPESISLAKLRDVLDGNDSDPEL